MYIGLKIWYGNYIFIDVKLCILYMYYKNKVISMYYIISEKRMVYILLYSI